MKLLLDTHTFIWWDSDPVRLTPNVLKMCQDPENLLLLSVASVWEMQIKQQVGKLRLNLSLSELIIGQQQTNNIKVLSVWIEHVLELDNLPLYHKDPFDRLLIAQAHTENAVLLSKDSIFSKYPI